MRQDILIDISAAVGQGAGIGRYSRELTRALIPMLPHSATRLWYAPERDDVDPALLREQPWNSLTVSRSWLSRRNVDRLLMRGQLPVRSLLRSGRPTDAYSPDFTAPPGKRQHITVHDLAWLHPEAQTPEPLAAYLGPVVERAVKDATTIFTVSAAVRNEVLTYYGVPEERVIVAPNAPAEHFSLAKAIDDATLADLGVHQPFLLFVGTIEPRKNVTCLLEALAQLPSDLMLVIAGKRGWMAAQQLTQVEGLGLTDRVVELGYVAEDLLARLYATAAVVVYPSWYEGFGLPVVEGLATGTPVVASDLEVFREVGGNEIETCDPFDPSSLADAIIRSLSGEAMSADRRARRIERAKRFCWTSSAAVVASRLDEMD